MNKQVKVLKYGEDLEDILVEVRVECEEEDTFCYYIEEAAVGRWLSEKDLNAFVRTLQTAKRERKANLV